MTSVSRHIPISKMGYSLSDDRTEYTEVVVKSTVFFLFIYLFCRLHFNLILSNVLVFLSFFLYFFLVISEFCTLPSWFISHLSLCFYKRIFMTDFWGV